MAGEIQLNGTSLVTESSTRLSLNNCFRIASANRTTNVTSLNDYIVNFESVTNSEGILSSGSSGTNLTFAATGIYLFILNVNVGVDANGEYRIESYFRNDGTIISDTKAIAFSTGLVDSVGVENTLNNTSVVKVTDVNDIFTLLVNSESGNSSNLIEARVQFLKLSD